MPGDSVLPAQVDAGPGTVSTTPAAAARRPSDQATLAGLAGDLLPALIARLDASELGELEVRGGGWLVRLRRPYDRRRPVVAGDVRRRRAHPAHGSGSAASAAAGGGDPAGRPTRDAGTGAFAGAPTPLMPHDATSPAVGYYLPRDGMTTGRPVRAGDVLGYVDCLGVRHDVVAPADGVIGAAIAQPGEAVEYGQALVHLVAAASESGDVATSEPVAGAPPGVTASPPTAGAVPTAAAASPAAGAEGAPPPHGELSVRVDTPPADVPALGPDGRESTGPGATPSVASGSSAARHGTA